MAVFDSIAKTYDTWYEQKMGSFADEAETGLAFRLFKPEKGIRILDAGCGTGNFSIKLAKMGCTVTGIDISEEMLDLARKKAEIEKLDIDFRTMDLYNLDFPDEHFDAVFSMATFEFILEPQKAMDELFRVARKGSQLLVGTIHGNSSWGRLYTSEEFRNNTVFKHARFMTLEELTSIHADRLVSSGECLFIPPFTPDEEVTMENEERLEHSERGGYICALWKK